MKTKKLIIIFLIFGVVGFTLGKTALSFKSNKDSVSQIQNILESTCECEAIEKSMYAKGVQYSSEEGFTTEKVDFILKNCNYDDLEEEGERIAIALKEHGLEKFSLITLEFISNNKKQETAVFRNGKLQY